MNEMHKCKNTWNKYRKYIYMHYSILYNTFTIHMNWAGYLRK